MKKSLEVSVHKAYEIKSQATAQDHTVVRMATKDEFQTVIERSAKKEKEQSLYHGVKWFHVLHSLENNYNHPVSGLIQRKDQRKDCSKRYVQSSVSQNP